MRIKSLVQNSKQGKFPVEYEFGDLSKTYQNVVDASRLCQTHSHLSLFSIT